jgi:hypothetical protein
VSRGYRDRPPGAKRTGRLQNREAAEAAALRENLKKRKAQARARDDLPSGAAVVDDSKDLPMPGGGAIANSVPKA